MDKFLNDVIAGDALTLIPQVDNNSVHCCISDIPYGISLDDWDVLHRNSNSALLGHSPAQEGKSGFKRRGKPIRGWSEADRLIPKEYQQWCSQWASMLYPKMKDGASLFIFGARRTIHRAIVALEDSGFLLKDILAWEKKNAHHRAQRISIVMSRRGLQEEADKWSGWRLGNLAPIWEPIAWFFKPYPHTITDVVLENEVGAINVEAVQTEANHARNLVRSWFRKDEHRWHEAQKPTALLEYLLRLSTREGQVIIDPFAGSGSTAVACQRLRRRFICFELDNKYVEIAKLRLAAAAKQASGPGEATPVQTTMFDDEHDLAYPSIL